MLATLLLVVNVAVGVPSGERLGWDQAVSTGEDINSLKWKVFIDSTAGTLLGSVTCKAITLPTLYTCEAPLPLYTAGNHTLYLQSLSADQQYTANSEPLSFTIEPATVNPGAPAGIVHISIGDILDALMMMRRR